MRKNLLKDLKEHLTASTIICALVGVLGSALFGGFFPLLITMMGNVALIFGILIVYNAELKEYLFETKK
jgi:hypothetical protein